MFAAFLFLGAQRRRLGQLIGTQLDAPHLSALFQVALGLQGSRATAPGWRDMCQGRQRHVWKQASWLIDVLCSNGYISLFCYFVSVCAAKTLCLPTAG